MPEHRTFRTSILAIATALSAPTLAQAQAGDPQSTKDIIVTAQRRSEVLEDVPMAVQVVTAQTLENAGIKNFMDLGNIAVGTKMGWNGAVPTVTVRGITSALSSYSAEPNVAVYIDGMYESQPVTMSADLSNVKNIQVLKGPQGTLYGRNATGGAVLIDTLGPSDVFTGKLDASYENFHRVTLDGYIAAPLAEGLRFSLSGHYRHGDLSLRRSDPNAAGRTIGAADTFYHANVRAKLEADLSDNLTALFTFSHSEIDDPRANFYNTFEHRPPTYPAPPVSAPATAFGVVSNGTDSPYFGNNNTVSLKLEWKTGIGTLTSFTGYTDRNIGYDLDFDGTYARIVDFTDRYDQKSFQQSLDYSITAIDKLVLNVGGLYYRDDNTQNGAKGNFNYSGGNLGSITRRNNYTHAWALYIDGTYSITDKLTINAGGRYSYDKKRFVFSRTNGTGGALPITAAPTGPLSDQRDWNEFTPRATIRYELAPRTSIYASYSRGFRSGVYGSEAINLPTATQAVNWRLIAAEPEKINAYEIGFKTGGGKLRFQAAAFYYDYTNLQVSIARADPILGIVILTQNSKGAKVKGFEMEATYNPIPNLTLRGGISLINAYYTQFANAVGTGVNATNTLNISNQTQDLSGKELVRAPDYSGSIGFDYEQPTDIGTFLLTSTLSFTDSYVVSNPSVYGPLAPVELRNQQRLRQKAYQTLSAQLKWTDRSDHFSIAVFGDNLNNASYPPVLQCRRFRRLQHQGRSPHLRRAGGRQVLSRSRRQ